jgi:hypothetical protein
MLGPSSQGYMEESGTSAHPVPHGAVCYVPACMTWRKNPQRHEEEIVRCLSCGHLACPKHLSEPTGMCVTCFGASPDVGELVEWLDMEREHKRMSRGKRFYDLTQAGPADVPFSQGDVTGKKIKWTENSVFKSCGCRQFSEKVTNLAGTLGKYDLSEGCPLCGRIWMDAPAAQNVAQPVLAVGPWSRSPDQNTSPASNNALEF